MSKTQVQQAGDQHEPDSTGVQQGSASGVSKSCQVMSLFYDPLVAFTAICHEVVALIPRLFAAIYRGIP